MCNTHAMKIDEYILYIVLGKSEGKLGLLRYVVSDKIIEIIVSKIDV